VEQAAHELVRDLPDLLAHLPRVLRGTPQPVELSPRLRAGLAALAPVLLGADRVPAAAREQAEREESRSNVPDSY